jgi:hypothetical protein
MVVSPFTTNFALLLQAVLPTRVWDWAMRKVGFLALQHLGHAPGQAKRPHVAAAS